MNCQHVKRLLPLCIGNDLPDDADANALQAHISKCPQCARQHRDLQQSLDALQSVSTASLPVEHTSLWPRLVSRLQEMPRRRDHFNGWIPAAAMALAATLMVAVSVSQVRRGMGDASPVTWRTGPAALTEDRDPFAPDRQLAPGNGPVGVDREKPAVPHMVVGPPKGQLEYHW